MSIIYVWLIRNSSIIISDYITIFVIFLSRVVQISLVRICCNTWTILVIINNTTLLFLIKTDTFGLLFRINHMRQILSQRIIFSLQFIYFIINWNPFRVLWYTISFQNFLTIWRLQIGFIWLLHLSIS